ncbi:MAG: TonB-dependent receptor [Acidobacteria bacterium]|nr:TonB-dependent receptor [Acidobacteriota bacterium]
MRRASYSLTVFLVVFGLMAGLAQAQTQVGTVEGKVVDQQGGVLPGVSVVLIGPMGTKTTVTDAQGEFRFVGLAPTTYALKVELSGFLTQQRDGVAVGMGKTVAMDFSLKVGGVTESVEVTANAVTVDVKSSSTDTNLSNELLTAMPIYSSTSTGLLNYAPGINSSSAYGGQGSYGNALLLDGVDTRDPEGGSAWTFFNQNLIDEIQIGGLGAAAEYGGFTGAVVNTVTKSGGNVYSGLFTMRYTKASLAGKNITKAVLDLNPGLGSSDITRKLVDYSVQLGGPIMKNKAFFFGSVQRYSANTDPSGPLKTATDVSPRLNLKLTFQPSPSDTVILGVQYDQYNVTGRVGFWPGSQAIDSATVTEDAPEWVWNAQYRKVFGSNTLFEAKLTGYTGYYYLDPVDPAPPVVDYETNTYSGGGGGQYYADRSRNQVIVSLSKYAQAYGSHSFKFGAEIERSHVRSQYQPYGPAGFYVLDYYGSRYRYTYGYDVQGDNRRTSAYAQDQWSVGRLTLNLGLRMDHIRGYSPVLKANVYTPKDSWGPRLGAAVDLTGKGTTVLRGFWGRYYEGTATGFYTSATPGIQDYTSTEVFPNGSLGTPVVLTPALVYGISKDIKHPKTDELSAALEQQFFGNVRLVATGIWRTTGNFINNVINGALWSPIQRTNGLTHQPYTAYYWNNRNTTGENFYIRNIAGYQYKSTDGSVIATADPQRDYKALMLMLSRSLKNRWAFQASYVLSKAEGNVDNSGFGNWLGGNTWASPNTAIINNIGELTNSRRHEIKIYLTYQVPKVEVMLSGSFTGMSGRPYAAYEQLSTGALNIPGSGRRQIYLEPRGSKYNDFYKNFDLRAEKVFQVSGHRFGVYADVTNLFNTATITSRITRYPSSALVLYGSPSGVQGARQATIGGRWSF